MSEKFQCEFCKKIFQRESSLTKHKCTKKTRMLDKDTRTGRIAVEIWVSFREYNRFPIKAGLRRWDAFINAKEYTAFMEFAAYLVETQIIKQEDFIQNLLKESVPIRFWCTHKTRQEWIQKALRREHPDIAIERSLLIIQDWANENDKDWNTFFTEISVGRAILWIETGKISPWILQTAGTFKHLIDRMHDNELSHIFEFLDPSVWSAKMIKHQSDVSRIKEAFREYNF